MSKIGQKKDLLIYFAEDNIDDRRFVEHSFSKNNHAENLVCHSDGSELISALEKGIPSCILLDMNMPVTDGFEVLKYLQASKLKSIPVFVMSSSKIHEEILKEKGCKPSAFIMKPVTFEKTMAALDMLHSSP